jgi:hypothetical protein
MTKEIDPVTVAIMAYKNPRAWFGRTSLLLSDPNRNDGSVTRITPHIDIPAHIHWKVVKGSARNIADSMPAAGQELRVSRDA